MLLSRLCTMCNIVNGCVSDHKLPYLYFGDLMNPRGPNKLCCTKLGKGKSVDGKTGMEHS